MSGASTALALPYQGARLTGAACSATDKPDVVARKFVPAKTMSFAGVEGGGAFASKNVYLRGDRFQMIGIHAMTHPAQVVKRESGRDRADKMLVGPAMSGNGPTTGRRELSVTAMLGVKFAGPKPTPVGLLAYVSHESVDGCSSYSTGHPDLHFTELVTETISGGEFNS
jgi:hypothetical protein